MDRLKLLFTTIAAIAVGAVAAAPASGAGIVFDEYPASAIATEQGTHAFDFANRSVLCSYHGFYSPQVIKGPAETMEAEASPGNCTSNLENEVTLDLNGCRFIYYPNPGPGIFDIGPPGCGPIVVEGSNCTRSIPAQQGLSASFTNQGSGSTATVRIDESAAVQYTVTKGNLFVCAPMSGLAGYSGSWTVAGIKEGEPVGARVVSQLPIGFYVAGEASEVEANRPRFEAESTPASLSGEQNVADPHAISFQNRVLHCAEVDWEAGVSEATQNLTLTSSYDDCEAIVLGNLLPASIEMNSCSYELNALNAGPPYEGSLDIVCAAEGDAIEVEVYNTESNPESDPPVCAYEIGPQSGLGTVGLDNQGKGHDREVVVDLGLTGVAYSRTVGKGLVCGQATATASYSGTSTLQGHE